MIGMICISAFQYYDNTKHKMAFKGRPVLVIGQADNGDYVVLPISRVTNRANLDMHYDYKMEPETYAETGFQLSDTSFVRTHKQAVLNDGEITKEVLNLKDEFPEVYSEIIDLVEEFQKELISRARI
ncbi:MAG: hypothetical protein HDR09_12810 [Lachnospiraceae bacterium]|nr:hypothetical protein [Lachnospiraceae bacterium]